MKCMSLFSNIGVGEAYLDKIGIEVVVANELVRRRANLYSQIYPQANMICGDITDHRIYNKLIEEGIKQKIDIIKATPPCQGMSNAGQKRKWDPRNNLIIPVIGIITTVRPKYAFIENVSTLLVTKISHKGQEILISDLIGRKLSEYYHINIYTIDTKDYSVPQFRERAIILFTRRDQRKIWTIPPKDKKIVTMKDAIGSLSIVDPFVKDISCSELKKLFPKYYERKAAAQRISKWHNPPHHIRRQVEIMMRTPTGCSAFDNKIYKPRKANGELVRGYKNTYKRQNWDTPAYTVTMDNRKISSQNNVHPGRYLGKNKRNEELYSDPRALTLYEIMKIMTIPDNWPVPNNVSQPFLRSVIGEGIPPLFVKKTFQELIK